MAYRRIVMKNSATAPLRLNVRFDDEELRRQVEESAKKACRSMQGEIIYRLRQTFSNDPVAAA